MYRALSRANWARVACVILLSVPLSAHDLARSESRLDVQGSEIHCSLIVDLLEFPNVDSDGNGRIGYDELDRSIASVFASVKEHLIVRGPTDPSTIVMTRHELLDEHTVRMELAYGFPANVSRLEVTSTFDQMARRPDHQHVVTALMSGTRHDAVLDASSRTAIFEDRFWTRTSLGLTLAAVLILGVRVAVFLYQRRARATRRT